MRAAWYEHRGPAADSLVVGEMPEPVPGPGEVRIALSVSGISPGDIKKRSGWKGEAMPYPRVIPHSDGAGIIDAVGDGVDPGRVGRAAWCYGAQSYRAFGTAAEQVVVPDGLAIDLATDAGDTVAQDVLDQAACLGIAGITGYRAIFAAGPVRGLTVLVHGATGGVGSIATQMALRDGAEVIAVVRPGQEERAHALGVHHVLQDGADGLAGAIREIAPGGVHRIAEVDFAAHIDLDAEVIAVGGVIASYATSAEQPPIPYWTLGFADVTLRLLGSDDFTPAVKAQAGHELTAALLEGRLASHIAERVPLDEVARAHELIESHVPGRVLLTIP